MKKSILFLFSALALAACSQPTIEQKIEAYQAETGRLIDSYQQQMGAIMADTTLTMEQKSAKAVTVEESIEKQLVDLGIKTIRKNKNNDLAIVALKDIYYMAEPAELDKLITALSDSLQQTPFVQRIAESVAAKKTTSEGCKFTDFTVVQDPSDEQGSTVKFSDFVGNGKYMLVDFWASWCGPCKREIPNIKAIYEKYASDEFGVLSVAVWDEPQATRDTAAVYGVCWNEIVNAQRIPTDIYGIDGIPHIMLIGPDGTILKRNLRGEDIEKEVSAALGR